MKKNVLALLIASSIGLYGCGDDSELTGNPSIDPIIEKSLQAETKIKFDLLTDPKNPVVVAPTFLAMDPKDGTLVLDGKVDEEGYASDLSKIENSEIRTKAAIGKTDGWSTTQPFIIEFTGNELAPRTAESSFHLIKPATSTEPPKVLRAPIDFKVEASGKKLIITLNAPLAPASDYMFAITDDLKDIKGHSVGMTGSYGVLKTTSNPPSEKLLPAQDVVHKTEKAFEVIANINSDSIIFSTPFTTASAGNSLYATKAAMAKVITTIDKLGGEPADSNAASYIWKNSGINLTGLYSISLNNKKDYADALDDNDNFFLNLAEGDQVKAATIKGGLNLVYKKITDSGHKLNVYEGTIKLPYFLGGADNNAWRTSAWKSATPSIAKIKYILTSNQVSKADRNAITNQLKSLNVDQVKLLKGDFDEVAKLVGTALTLSNGDQLDSERLVTRYSPLPQIQSVKSVPILVFVPEINGVEPENMGTMIYQHGITSVKETALLMAANHMATTAAQHKTPYAIVAIDHPLHGKRALVTKDENGKDKVIITTPATADTYMNLEYLPVARDNIRQSVIDDLGVRAGLEVMSKSNDPVLSKFDMSNVSFFGHSLGAITGLGSYATANKPLQDTDENEYFKFSAGTFASPGAAIPSLLLESETFSGDIKHGIYLSDAGYNAQYENTCKPAKTPKGKCFANYYASLDANSKYQAYTTFQTFAGAAQTVLDTTDPLNLAKDISGPVYLLQAEDDKVVPNSSTKRLLPHLNLKSIKDIQSGGKYIANFSAEYDSEDNLTKGLAHSSVLMPSSIEDNLFKPWQAVTKQITSFTSDPNNVNVPDEDKAYLVK